MIMRRAFSLFISIFLIAAPRVAFAHAELVRSFPAAGAGLAATPHTIQLWFSEAPAVALTVITLTAEDGRVIQLGPVDAVRDTSVSVIAALNGVLAPGTYTVKWRTVAADDGHPSNGSFSFEVNAAIGVTGVASAATSPATAPTTATPERQDGDSTVQSAMGVESPAYVIVRWLSFMSLVLLVGVVAFRIFVLPRVGAAPARALARAGSHPLLTEAMLPQLARLGLLAGLTVLIAAVGRLMAEQSVMAASMTMGVVDIVRETGWGSAWLLQIGAALVACAGFALARHRSATGWGMAAMAALILAVTPALSGHAAGMPHWRAFAVATDAVHVIAAGAWLGSLCALVIVGLPTAMRAQSRDASAGLSAGLTADMVNAFSPIALASAAIVVLTGLISAWLRLGSVSALWRTSYGVVLLIKLALVGGVFAGGAFNWLRMRAALARHALDHAASDHGEVPPLSSNVSSSARVRFQQSGAFELVFGVLVIAVTAVLVAVPTPVR